MSNINEKNIDNDFHRPTYNTTTTTLHKNHNSDIRLLKIFLMIEEHKLENGDFKFPKLPKIEEIDNKYHKKRKTMKGVDRMVHDLNISEDDDTPAVYMYLCSTETSEELMFDIADYITYKSNIDYIEDYVNLYVN